MKSASEIPAVLTIHETAPGQFVLRISDLKYRALTVGVSKLLPASSLVVVTPSDVKVFQIRGNGVTNETSTMGPDRSGEDKEDSSSELDAETLAAIAEQESHAVPNAEQPQIETGPRGEEIVGETQEGRKVVRRPHRKASEVAGRDAPCGRCRGTGQAQVILEGGKPSSTVCPLCQGRGTYRKYGDPR